MFTIHTLRRVCAFVNCCGCDPPPSPVVQDALFVRGKKVEFVYLLTKGSVGLHYVRQGLRAVPGTTTAVFVVFL